MDITYEDSKLALLQLSIGFLLSFQRKIENNLEIMTKIYKHRNEVKRYFLRLKHFRKV